MQTTETITHGARNARNARNTRNTRKTRDTRIYAIFAIAKTRFWKKNAFFCKPSLSISDAFSTSRTTTSSHWRLRVEIFLAVRLPTEAPALAF